MSLPRLALFLIAVLLLAGCAATAPIATQSLAPSDYILGSGDQLQVTVLGQADLSGTYLVDASGRVSMPLIGQIQVEGATAPELEARIEAALRQNYLRNPNVTVQIGQYRPFFILGEVVSAGQYPYIADLTVQQAIAIAGGFTPRAQQSTVEVVRQYAGQTYVLRLGLLDLILPGDTVTVRQRLL